MTATLANYFGDRHFPYLFGMLVFCQAIAGFAAPLLAGMAFDKFGSYQSSWLVAAAACVVCAVCLAITPPPSPRSVPGRDTDEPPARDAMAVPGGATGRP
jgi:MFS family permease